MHFNVREDIIQLTSKWTGERFPDGVREYRMKIWISFVNDAGRDLDAAF